MNIPDYQLLVLEKPEITCQDVRAILDDYCEDILTESLVARLDSHIDSCKYCKSLKEGYQEVIQLAKGLRKVSNVDMPQGTRTRLRATLNARLGLKMELKE
jgi:Putative zinc-finger